MILMYSSTFLEKELINKVDDLNVIMLKEGLSIDSLENFKNIDVLVISAADKVDANMIDVLLSKGVKHIITKSVGMDHIDVLYAKSNGIYVYNIQYDSDFVAEYTMMCLLSCNYKTKRISNKISSNDGNLKDINFELLRRKKIGIIGMGKIGLNFVSLLEPFGCEIFYYNRSYRNDKYTYLELEDLLQHCDVISLHCDANSDNYNMLNKERFNLLKDDVILINTARGELIDEEELYNFFNVNKKAQCYLDVFKEDLRQVNWSGFSEYDEIIKKIDSLDNVIVAPHAAYNYNELKVQRTEILIELLKKL